MKNKNLDKGIKEIQNIKMTSLEKSQILHSVLNSPAAKKQAIKSPYHGFSLSYFLSNTRLAYTFAVCLILVLSSSGLVFASEASLPDSILYPIKVKVIEPINGALKFSSKEKARYESELSLKRISEAEALSHKNKLDDANKKKLGDLLLNHMDALNKEIIKTDDSREANKIINNFTEEMNVRAKILDKNKENDKKIGGDKLGGVSTKESKKQDDNHKRITEETKPEDLEISNVVKINTEKIKENQKRKEQETLNKDIPSEKVYNDTIDTERQNSESDSSGDPKHGERDKKNQRENNDN